MVIINVRVSGARQPVQCHQQTGHCQYFLAESLFKHNLVQHCCLCAKSTFRVRTGEMHITRVDYTRERQPRWLSRMDQAIVKQAITAAAGVHQYYNPQIFLPSPVNIPQVMNTSSVNILGCLYTLLLNALSKKFFFSNNLNEVVPQLQHPRNRHRSTH